MSDNIRSLTNTRVDYGKYVNKHVVYIDSRNRDNDSHPTSKFTVRIQNTLENVISLKVIGAHVPNTDFIISDTLRNNILYILNKSTSEIITITLPDNNYTIQELVEALNDKMNQVFPPGTLSFVFNETSGRVNIVVSSSMILDQYLYFKHPDGITHDITRLNTIGTILGFGRVNGFVLTPGVTYIAQYLPSVYGDNALILLVNDYNTVSYPNKRLNQDIVGTSMIELSTPKNSLVFSNTNISAASPYYFKMPTNITKFSILFSTLEGDIPNFQGLNSAVIVEVECLRSSIYDRYLSSSI
jgi:hypothetical protein